MENPVTIAGRPHLFPSRTQKLSSLAPMILGGKLPGKVGRCRFKWLHGQAVKTPPFHGGNPGSIPGGVTNTVEEWELKSSHFSNQRRKHSVRKWLRGRASPCQGEGREVESRLPLQFFYPEYITLDFSIICAIGGTGRRTRFRFWRETV